MRLPVDRFFPMFPYRRMVVPGANYRDSRSSSLAKASNVIATATESEKKESRDQE
jgi:hypothetical protein